MLLFVSPIGLLINLLVLALIVFAILALRKKFL